MSSGMEMRYEEGERSRIAREVSGEGKSGEGKERRTSDFVGEDGLEDFALFFLFFEAHDGRRKESVNGRLLGW